MHDKLLTTCRLMPSQSPSSDCCPPGNSPQLIYGAWHRVVWDIPLASLENANKLEESARGIYIPCPEHYNGFCMHGKCEHSTNMLEPSCRCDAGYTGQHCEKKDYSVLYVVPGPVRFQYVLIAAVIGTIQIAIICVVVLCITRKCPRNNRIHRQKQNTGHYSSDNTTRASTSSSGNFESTELSSRVLSWSKISDNYGCGKGEE
nr:PREDICTED: tomoregulin-2-like [Phalacrocorax carbo]